MLIFGGNLAHSGAVRSSFSFTKLSQNRAVMHIVCTNYPTLPVELLYSIYSANLSYSGVVMLNYLGNLAHSGAIVLIFFTN